MRYISDGYKIDQRIYSNYPIIHSILCYCRRGVGMLAFSAGWFGSCCAYKTFEVIFRLLGFVPCQVPHLRCMYR